MIAWIPPVFTRTQNDVDRKTPLGVLNAGDVNRIAGNMQYLGGLLQYPVGLKADWQDGDFLHEADFAELYDTLHRLREYFPQNDVGWCISIPALPWNSWRKYNDVERLLLRMLRALEENKNDVTYCGDGEHAGERRGVL